MTTAGWQYTSHQSCKAECHKKRGLTYDIGGISKPVSTVVQPDHLKAVQLLGAGVEAVTTILETTSKLTAEILGYDFRRLLRPAMLLRS